jgi:hypothetical protein
VEVEQIAEHDRQQVSRGGQQTGRSFDAANHEKNPARAESGGATRQTSAPVPEKQRHHSIRTTDPRADSRPGQARKFACFRYPVTFVTALHVA